MGADAGMVGGMLRVSIFIRCCVAIRPGPIPRIQYRIVQALLYGAEAGVGAGVQEPEGADFLDPA